MTNHEAALRTVVVAGVGMTAFGKFLDRSIKSVVAESVQAAIKDSEMDDSDKGIDTSYYANTTSRILQGRQGRGSAARPAYANPAAKLALRRMQPRGGGHIINIASLAGETYFPGFATYCATKYGVLGFSDAARLESAGTGVAISSVLPTFTNTELTSGIGGTKGLKNAEPEDIAAAIAKLILKPKPRMRVTRLAGIAVQAMKFLPHRAAEAMGHLLGTDQFITRINVQQRNAYEQRARGAELRSEGQARSPALSDHRRNPQCRLPGRHPGTNFGRE